MYTSVHYCTVALNTKKTSVYAVFRSTVHLFTEFYKKSNKYIYICRTRVFTEQTEQCTERSLMTNAEIEKIASRSDNPIPADATLPEQLAIYKIRALLVDFNTGTVTQNDAKLRKVHILMEKDRNEHYLSNGKRALKWIAQFNLAIYTASCRFRKDPNIETARHLIDQIDGFERFEDNE